MTKSLGLVWCWTLFGLLSTSFELGCSKGATRNETPDTTPQVSWPAAVSGHVATALDLSRQSWSIAVLDSEAWERVRARFDSELDELAAITNDGLLGLARMREGDDSTAKLIVIASYRRSHEERIRSIADRFHYEGPPPDWDRRLHAPPGPPSVTEAWARADDRLAWEYLLLRPSPRGYALFEIRAHDALRMIDDPASVQTGVLCIRLAVTSPVASRTDVNYYLKRSVGFLFAFPSTASLDAVLEFPAWVGESPVFAVAAQGGLETGSNPSSREVTELQNHPIWLIQRVMQSATRNEGSIRRRERLRSQWLELVDSYAPTAPPERKPQLMKLRAALLLEPLPGRPRPGTVKE